MDGDGSFSSSPLDDAKVRKKYAHLVEMALKIEDSDPAPALELYKQAEELVPGTCADSIARIRARIKSGNTQSTSSQQTTISTTIMNKITTTNDNTTTETTTTTTLTSTAPLPSSSIPIQPSFSPPPLPPPISEEDTPSSLPDFSQDDFLQSLPPPPPPHLSTSSDSTSSSPLTAAESSNEELEVFLEQIVDFIQVMSKEDIDEMVERKDFQLISYLMASTTTRPPCKEHEDTALKTAQCFMATCELVPSAFGAMVESRVVSWVVRWLKYYIVPKVEAAKVEESIYENDDSIVYFLQLVAILCGQQQIPLSLQERELLDDQAFVTMMIQFAIHEYDYNENSDIAFEAAVCLYGISSQFPVPSEDPIVFALYGIPEAATLGRFLIHVTNRGITPKWLQASALATSRKLFEFSQTRQSECYFFTNDMHVLVDVVVREVLNLDEEQTKVRMEYMKLLRAIITHHEYLANGKYKHDSVVEVVACIAFQDYDPPASAFAQNLFESIVDNKS